MVAPVVGDIYVEEFSVAVIAVNIAVIVLCGFGIVISVRPAEGHTARIIGAEGCPTEIRAVAH